jgi:putative membrane protein
MKINFTKPIPFNRSLLTLSFGCALACLPLGHACAQDVGPAPAKLEAEDSPAASSTATPASATSKFTAKEKEFVKKAGAGNAAEVKAGELASTNGESRDVKDFGAKMVKDHGDANTDLGTIAKSHDIEFPPAETAKQKMMYDKLSKLNGAEFDKMYVKEMVADHEKDLAEYKMEKTEAKDPDLKAYVDKTEGVVAEHLKMIKDIESKMGSEKKS